jgi:hypothetical protein
MQIDAHTSFGIVILKREWKNTEKRIWYYSATKGEQDVYQPGGTKRKFLGSSHPNQW